MKYKKSNKIHYTYDLYFELYHKNRKKKILCHQIARIMDNEKSIWTQVVSD